MRFAAMSTVTSRLKKPSVVNRPGVGSAAGKVRLLMQANRSDKNWWQPPRLGELGADLRVVKPEHGPFASTEIGVPRPRGLQHACVLAAQDLIERHHPEILQ